MYIAYNILIYTYLFFRERRENAFTHLGGQPVMWDYS